MCAAPHRLSFSSHPLALLAASFACGVWLAHVLTLPKFLPLAGGAICTALAVYALGRARLNLATSFLVLAFVCAGATLMLWEQESIGTDRVRHFYEAGLIASGAPVELTGGLERAPEVAPDGLYFAVRAERVRFKGAEQPASGAVQLFAPVRDESAREQYARLELWRGARVRVTAALERVEQFRNPGGSSLTEFLDGRGLDATAVIKSPLLVERLDDERVLLPLVWLDEWREALRERMARTFTPETAGVLAASLLGNRYGLSRASAERFREGGTFHVLVISGLHITFIGGLAWWLARLVTRRRGWQFASAVLVTWAYALAVGAEVSVVRAGVMFTVVALAPVLSRRAQSLNALGGAALALLAWRPSDLFDPSFQLTFLSVWSIVALGWPLLGKLREAGEWRPLRETPRPPAVPRSFRALGEALYWGERAWRHEQRQNLYHCRLFKSRAAHTLGRWRVQALVRYCSAMIIISACAQLCLLPLLVIYFHRFSFAALPLNIIVGMLMIAASLSALTALAVAPVSAGLAWPFVWLTEQASWLMAHSVDPLAQAGIASVRLPEYTNWPAAVYALYFAPLLLLAYALAHWSPLRRDNAKDESVLPLATVKFAALAWCVLLILIFTHPLSAGRADGRLRVDFLDVGQGDAALLTLPDGTTLLVDGGGRARFSDRERRSENESAELFERDGRGIGEAVVSEYLWWRGLSRVDYLLATHAHADHIEGLNDVARNFRVRAAFVARAPLKETEFARLAATLDGANVPLEVIGQGDQLRFGGVVIDVLWPPRVADEAARSVSGNDDSIVLRVSYSERCLLLTGDIESRAEAALVKSVPAALRCDVVKVAHHGSRTSSTPAFVAATHARFAVVSVGAASPHGHPDSQVVARWRTGGAEVWQTGQRGTITISADGHDLRVESFVRE